VRGFLSATGLAFIAIVAINAVAQAALPAKPPENPEIDPGSMASALTLLAGAGMLLADKMRRNTKKSIGL
jgi:hypothetical protein